MTTEEPHSLTDILDQLIEGVDGKKVTLGDVMDLFGHRSFGPLLLVPGLLAISPVGAIPGVPTLLGIIIVLVAGQLAVGIAHPWLPGRLLSIKFSREKLEKGIDKGRPWAKRIDGIMKARLIWLTDKVVIRFIAAVCLVTAASMPPLELLPFAVFAPGLSIVALGLAITARDGYVVVAGLAFAAVTVGLVVYVLSGLI